VRKLRIERSGVRTNALVSHLWHGRGNECPCNRPVTSYDSQLIFRHNSNLMIGFSSTFAEMDDIWTNCIHSGPIPFTSTPVDKRLSEVQSKRLVLVLRKSPNSPTTFKVHDAHIRDCILVFVRMAIYRNSSPDIMASSLNFESNFYDSFKLFLIDSIDNVESLNESMFPESNR
jgi:hypothetical protein